MSTPVLQTSEQQATRLVAAMEHSGCSGVAQTLMDAGIGPRAVDVEAGIAALLDPSFTHVVFLYNSPETAVAHALAEGLEPSGFLERWAALHQALLAQLKRHRGRWVLLDASAAGLDPVSTVAAIGATPSAQAPGPVAPPPMALERLLTAGAVQAAPDIQRIAAHLSALSTPVNADQAAPPVSADPIRDYLELQAGIRLQTSARQEGEREAAQALTRAEQARAEAHALATARQAKIEQLSAANAAADTLAAERQSQLEAAAKASEMQKAEVAELKSENELLLLQLHQVQEELESWFLKSKAGEEELSSAKQATQDAEALANARQAEIEQAKAAAEKTAAELQARVEKANAAKAAADTLAAERQSQLEAAAKASEMQKAEVAELKSENELLLLQLHQVQEELEAWFLKAKDLGEELQRAKQSGRVAMEESKARLDQARQNKDIAEKLARERYDVIQELRREKRRLEKTLALPAERAPDAERAPEPGKQPIDPAKIPVLHSVMHEEPAPTPTPDRATGLGGLFHRRRRIKGLKKKDVAVIRASELFDADWYLQNNTDVAEAGFDAAEHYLAFGFAEGRNPSLHFNAASYLALNPDVSAAGDNPLLHYLKFGKAEGRAINVSDAG